MPPEQANYYRELKENGQLEHPSVPGRSIAWLSLFALPQWSGMFMDYDDPKITGPAEAFFG